MIKLLKNKMYQECVMEKDNSSIANVNINVPKGREIKISTTIRGRTPGYWKISNGSKCKDMNIPEIDAFEVMSKMTPQEFRVINILKKDILKYDTQNEEYYASCHVSYDPSTMSATEKNQFNTGVNRLIASGLMVREKRKHYMFNPAFILPTNYNKEEREWDSMCSKCAT